MGVVRFLLTSPHRIAPDAAARLYFTGPDGIPLGIAALADASGITIERDFPDSGVYYVPWPTDRGELMLCTASLMERAAPYQLAVELARGTLSQLRSQVFEWQEIGLMLPEGFGDNVQQAMSQFALAATSRGDLAQAEAAAAAAIETTLALGDQLCEAFVEQAINVRKRQTAPLPTWIGMALEQSLLDQSHARRFLAASNAAIVTLNWRHVESTERVYNWRVYDQQVAWCRQHQIPVVGGPLLKLDATGCPDWLFIWAGDFDNLISLVTDYVETVVERFRGRIAVWNCAARFAIGDALSLSEEECLHLAARAVEITRRCDPDTPVIMAFDQPWAEYMRGGDHELSPLHVADALLRSEVGLAGIALELNLGYHPGGSHLRPLLAVNRLLDWWATFGLPLYVYLTLPSATSPDPKAHLQTGVIEHGPWSVAIQERWAEQLVSLCAAKPAIHGIFWNACRDDEPHDFPHSGLWDAQGEEKTVLTLLRRFRRRHLR
ncbi:MAG: endo-1,4-beta-xylanase [Pirellulales bacterium]|nr:endo-1,4-beta-xylanase [Pirellulales bacterium]